jgi:hypothetical protein
MSGGKTALIVPSLPPRNQNFMRAEIDLFSFFVLRNALMPFYGA